MKITNKKFNFKLMNDVSNIDNFINKSFKKILRDKLRDLYDAFLRRKFYQFFLKNFFINQNYNINLVLPSKGFSQLARKKKLNEISKIKNKDIICLGCGNGYDLLDWLKFKPKSITGVDILNYSKSWKQIKNYLDKNKIQTKITFIQKDILRIDNSRKFDFIVSDAVFEHLKDFQKIIKKCNYLLKSDGVMYASYGPLWYNLGGDHFSSRNNIKEGFNHLLLKKNEYLNFFKKNVSNLTDEIKLHGSAGIFVKKNLFSKLTGTEYMETYSKNNFYSKYTVVEYCPDAFQLVNKDNTLKKKLLKITKFKDLENFYLKAQVVYLKKVNS